jgi:hypothetical protein
MGKGSRPVTSPPRVAWPDGRDFAFTVFDDTDASTLVNAPPVYALLGELGMRTTKSVWPLTGRVHGEAGGSSCEDEAYRDWVLALQRDGFEIALHNVGADTSPREETIRGLERFRELFGHDPVTHTNHAGNRENVYWGDRRLTGANALAYNVMNRFKGYRAYEGHIESSPLFWGDLCRERVRYVRNFVHSDINTLAYCPEMPYHDPARPCVNAWFASTEGADVDLFVDALSEAAQDRLEAEGGACIMYTHFWSFTTDGRLDPRFERLMRRLSAKNGWFVPVSTLLDHLVAAKGRHQLTDAERSRLERRWLLDKAARAAGTLRRARARRR